MFIIHSPKAFRCIACCCCITFATLFLLSIAVVVIVGVNKNVSNNNIIVVNSFASDMTTAAGCDTLDNQRIWIISLLVVEQHTVSINCFCCWWQFLIADSVSTAFIDRIIGIEHFLKKKLKSNEHFAVSFSTDSLKKC